MDKRHCGIDDSVSTHTIGRGEDLLGGDVGEEGVTVGGLALTAGPLMPLRHTNYQVGSIRSGIAQAVETIFVQKAQVLFKRRIVKLPVTLRILAVSTGGMQDRNP